ncbi:hypothetical protein B4U80_13950 [Leptotrombidium deliense]|uniref:Caspase family p20 domain-containing protein n=1 Tax=Leptotrombidium deliense TaxID=299467 RepID=A0A443S6P8_9ACAR|nr:hypothetical protein B4U80_13950 [Leptotrombidium deliense]
MKTSEIHVHNMRKRFFFYPNDLLSLKPELKRLLFIKDNIHVYQEKYSLLESETFNVIETSEMKFPQLRKEMADLFRSNADVDGAIFVFINSCKENMTLDEVNELALIINDIYSDAEIPKFILFNGLHKDKNADLKSTGRENFELIFVNQSSEANHSLFSLKQSFVQAFCDKVTALKDIELRQILTLSHTDGIRHNFSTHSHQVRKKIFLNISSKFQTTDDCYPLKRNGKSLFLIVNTCTFEREYHIMSSLRDAARLTKTMRSLGHIVMPKISITVEEMMSILATINAAEINDYYAFVVFLICSTRNIKIGDKIQKCTKTSFNI